MRLRCLRPARRVTAIAPQLHPIREGDSEGAVQLFMQYHGRRRRCGRRGVLRIALGQSRPGGTKMLPVVKNDQKIAEEDWRQQDRRLGLSKGQSVWVDLEEGTGYVQIQKNQQ